MKKVKGLEEIRQVISSLGRESFGHDTDQDTKEFFSTFTKASATKV